MLGLGDAPLEILYRQPEQSAFHRFTRGIDALGGPDEHIEATAVGASGRRGIAVERTRGVGATR